MKDLIDRQAAIDEIKKLFSMGEHYCDKFSIVGMLNSLPSVQLEGIRCNECKYYQGVHGAMGHAPCSYWNSGGVMWDWCCSRGEKYMSDLISRAEAIDIIMSLIEEPEDDFNEAVRCSAKMVMDLPSAQPKQRWTQLMNYLADLQLACSPNCGANGCGDEKLYAFVTGLIKGLQGKNMNDLISRQVAIDEVHKNYDTILDFKSDGRTVADSFEDIINALPPAQLDAIKCKDCKYCEKVDHDLMCCNVNSWVVATHDDFGCVLAERRTDERTD